MTLLLTLVVGPLLFFSTIGGFVAPNPIHNGNLEFMFIIKKSLNSTELSKMEKPPNYLKEKFNFDLM